MKKIIVMLILFVILLSSVSCNQFSFGEKETAKETSETNHESSRQAFCGTWNMVYAEKDGKTYSVDYLIKNGAIKKTSVCTITLHPDGKYTSGNTSGSWYVVSDEMFLIDETAVHVVNDKFYFTIDKIRYYYQKASAEESETKNTTEPSTNGLRKDFKDAMDSYEAFCDEYCSFMTQYMQNPTDLSLLTRYAGMLSKYQKLTEDFEKWESQDLNDAEMKYYLEVQTRVAQKMIDIVL